MAMPIDPSPLKSGFLIFGHSLSEEMITLSIISVCVPDFKHKPRAQGTEESQKDTPPAASAPIRSWFLEEAKNITLDPQ